MNRILLVDDHTAVRKALRRCFEVHHYHCTEAEDGLAALTWFQQEHPVDLVITDNQMPNMTGLQFLKKLGERLGPNMLPVILYSGNLTEELKEEAFHAGAYAVLSKPCDFQVLITAVAGALHR